MRVIWSLFAMLVAALACASCEERSEPCLHFVGDSLTEFWDVSSVCPTLDFVNHGRAGAGIAYLDEFDRTLEGEVAVMILGTNDLWQMLAYGADDYAGRYIAAINRLGLSKLYLYPVLPRKFEGDPEGSHEAICAFNEAVKSRLGEFECVVEYMDVYDRFRLGSTHLPNPELYPDGLHINVYGYQILADELWKRLYR